MELKDAITLNVCQSTVYEDSWIWYCDEHRQHGTALCAEEAEAIAEAHVDYHLNQSIEYAMEQDGDEFELGDLEDYDICDMYILSEKMNKTFTLGEDYTDSTPNKITDIEQAQEMRKHLGLP